jgi:hypothetical protein
MPAFIHMVTLLSFVLAIAISHELFSVVEIVRAGARVKHSMVHAIWMLNCLLLVVGWWVGVWDLHVIRDWPVVSVLMNFAAVIPVFLAIAFVSPRVPAEGTLDLWDFHERSRKTYAPLIAVAAVLGSTIGMYYGAAFAVPGQNLQAVFTGLTALGALVTIFTSSLTAQRAAALISLAGTVLFLIVGDPVLRS